MAVETRRISVRVSLSGAHLLTLQPDQTLPTYTGALDAQSQQPSISEPEQHQPPGDQPATTEPEGSVSDHTATAQGEGEGPV